MNDCEYIVKYVIIGDSFVGKSSIMSRYISDRFKPTDDATIGVEFGCKIVNINSTRYKLHLWDTAGQEMFNSITQSYYRNMCVALVVFSFDKPESFKNVGKWINELKERTNNEELLIYLVGNKSDLKKTNITNEYNLKYFEVSAKDNVGVNNIFDISLKEVEHLIKTKSELPIGVVSHVKPVKQKEVYIMSCC
jgi:Ras-related protein Rab-2A